MGVFVRALLGPREGSITGGEGATRGGRGQSLALAERMPQLNEGVRLTTCTVLYFSATFRYQYSVSITLCQFNSCSKPRKVRSIDINDEGPNVHKVSLFPASLGQSH